MWQAGSAMPNLLMITFRCRPELFARLEKFAVERNIDRTSAIKLALHFYLNRRDGFLDCQAENQPME